MTVNIAVTEEQAKAITWLIGSVSSGVVEALNLDRLYDELYQEFGTVIVSNVERSNVSCWILVDGDAPVRISELPRPNLFINTT
jgi:hypothetical protein